MKTSSSVLVKNGKKPKNCRVTYVMRYQSIPLLTKVGSSINQAKHEEKISSLSPPLSTAADIKGVK